MAYAELSDLVAQVTADELALLCDDSGQSLFYEDASHTPEQAAAAAAARAVAERALEDASADVDGYVGKWKTVPLSDPPAFVVRITTDIAVYALYTRRNLAGMSEGRQARYEAAQKTLGRIARGEISLGGPPHTPVNSTATFAGLKGRSDRVFTRDTLADF